MKARVCAVWHAVCWSGPPASSRKPTSRARRQSLPSPVVLQLLAFTGSLSLNTKVSLSLMELSSMHLSEIEWNLETKQHLYKIFRKGIYMYHMAGSDKKQTTARAHWNSLGLKLAMAQEGVIICTYFLLPLNPPHPKFLLGGFSLW